MPRASPGRWESCLYQPSASQRAQNPQIPRLRVPQSSVKDGKRNHNEPSRRPTWIAFLGSTSPIVATSRGGSPKPRGSRPIPDPMPSFRASRRTAKPWMTFNAGAVAGSGALRASEYLGRAPGRRWSGYHRPMPRRNLSRAGKRSGGSFSRRMDALHETAGPTPHGAGLRSSGRRDPGPHRRPEWLHRPRHANHSDHGITLSRERATLGHQPICATEPFRDDLIASVSAPSHEAAKGTGSARTRFIRDGRKPTTGVSRCVSHALGRCTCDARVDMAAGCIERTFPRGILPQCHGMPLRKIWRQGDSEGTDDRSVLEGKQPCGAS